MDVYYYYSTDQDIKGSSMVRALQDVGIPVLDVLVRESIQNSLDAGDPSSDSPFVRMEYSTGTFDCEALDNELPGISLVGRASESNRFMAIRDRFTHGLRGDYLDPKSDLHKLVAGFMGNQRTEGSGGSWGLGKTVYYRLGIGLVIYYSRTRLEDGTYSSLLYAKLVEDEESSDSLVPAVYGVKSGIASWGEKIHPDMDNSPVRETRDEATIDRVLEIFGFEKFGEKETGTAIIIPFINEEDMLANNRVQDNESGVVASRLPWESSLDDYLSIAVQRWYTPRLNNLHYKKLYKDPDYLKDKPLAVMINGKMVGPDRQRNFSKLISSLYTKAILSLADDPSAENVEFNGHKLECEPIILRRSIDRLEAGKVAFVNLKRNELDTDGVSLYRYLNLEEKPGTPVIAYCRKAGMVVKYETASSWTRGVMSRCSEDEYIVGFFVVSPYPLLKKVGKRLSLDEYIRCCETAAHNQWDNDKQVDPKFEPEQRNYTPHIIPNISKQVGEKLAAAIAPPEPVAGERRRIQSISHILGSSFPIFSTERGSAADDGGSGSAGSGNGSNSKETRTTKGVSFKYEVSHSKDGLVAEVEAYTRKNKKAKDFVIEMLIDSASGSVSADSWQKEIGGQFPFVLGTPEYSVMRLDGTKSSEPLDCAVSVKKAHNNRGECYKLTFSFPDGGEHEFTVKAKVAIKANRRDLKPVIKFDV